jgi:hypothetical protein
MVVGYDSHHSHGAYGSGSCHWSMDMVLLLHTLLSSAMLMTFSSLHHSLFILFYLQWPYYLTSYFGVWQPFSIAGSSLFRRTIFFLSFPIFFFLILLFWSAYFLTFSYLILFLCFTTSPYFFVSFLSASYWVLFSFLFLFALFYLLSPFLLFSSLYILYLHRILCFR